MAEKKSFFTLFTTWFQYEIAKLYMHILICKKHKIVQSSLYFSFCSVCVKQPRYYFYYLKCHQIWTYHLSFVICWNKNGWSGEATSLWPGLTMTENVTKCPQFFSSYFICYTKYTSHFYSNFSFLVVRCFLKNLTIRDPILQFVQMNLDLKVGR